MSLLRSLNLRTNGRAIDHVQLWDLCARLSRQLQRADDFQRHDAAQRRDRPAAHGHLFDRQLLGRRRRADRYSKRESELLDSSAAAQGRTGWKVPVGLVYNSQNWRQDNGVNWKLGNDVGFGYGWQMLIGSITPYYTNLWGGVDHYVYTDSTGAQYRLDHNSSGIWTSSSQSVYVWLDTTVNPNRLHFKDGSFWVMGSTSAGMEQDAGAMYSDDYRGPVRESGDRDVRHGGGAAVLRNTRTRLAIPPTRPTRVPGLSVSRMSGRSVVRRDILLRRVTTATTLKRPSTTMYRHQPAPLFRT